MIFPNSVNSETEFAADVSRLFAALDRLDAASYTPLEWLTTFVPSRCYQSFADFHSILDSNLHNFHQVRGQRRAYLAPRGGAKSTHVTFGYVLRCALEGWEPYILILGETEELANKFLADIRDEITENERLREVYPDATMPGGEWRQGSIRLSNGVLIEAKGRGGKIRGRKNRRSRPSLIIIDDIQSNKDIVSPTERGHAWDWMTREVIPAGDERTNIISVGTALHREAVAVRVGELPGWALRVFKAVHAWPDRMDLWNEWERLATNLVDEDRAGTAARFYAEKSSEMDAGGVVYWPEKFPLPVILARLAEIGWNAFNTEYQQEPSAAEGAEWPSDYFDDLAATESLPARPFWFDSWDGILTIARVQFLDPSKGISARPGDYQAHGVVAIDRNGDLWVEFDMRREPVPEMVVRAIGHAGGAWGPVNELIIEDNGTMGFLQPEVERQMQAHLKRGGGMIPWRTITQTERKEMRIRCLGPYLSRGVNDSGKRRQLRVRNNPSGRIAVNQMRDFPLGDHDDGPDGLSLGVKRLEELLAGR